MSQESKGPGLIHRWMGSPTGRLVRTLPEMQDIPPTTELGRKIHQALTPIAVIQDELIYDLSKIDYAELELRTLAMMLGNPFYGKSPVEDIMRQKYQNKEHDHLQDPCSGVCRMCGEQVANSHDTRIEELEQQVTDLTERVEDLDRNLRELAGVPKTT